MLKNYFKIAFRNLWRNKSFSAINIFGLALGLAICLLITLFVIDELSYDKWNPELYKVYHVSLRINGDFLNNTPAPLAGFPSVNSACTFASASFGGPTKLK